MNKYQHGGDVYRNQDRIDFSVNINLLGIPDGVIRAAKKGVDLSYQYPDTECLDLRNAISSYLDKPLDYIICGNGAAELIHSLALATKPKKALLAVPSFHEYEQALSCMECQIQYYIMKEENAFSLQEDFLNHITKDIDIIFLCNPNNPTGEMIQPEFLRRILNQCEKMDTLLVVDECFMDFVEDGENSSMIQFCKTSQNLFVLKAFTKLYAMPGLRLGYGISSDRNLLSTMQQVIQPWSVSTPAQMAGIAALEERDYVKKSMELLKQERLYLIEELQKLPIKIFASKANYIFFKTEPGLFEYCLERGILIRDCSNYKGLVEGYYRIGIKKHEDNKKLLEILNRRYLHL